MRLIENENYTKNIVNKLNEDDSNEHSTKIKIVEDLCNIIDKLDDGEITIYLDWAYGTPNIAVGENKAEVKDKLKKYLKTWNIYKIDLNNIKVYNSKNDDDEITYGIPIKFKRWNYGEKGIRTTGTLKIQGKGKI